MLAPNTILQRRYRIVRQLKSGGMGAVYESLDERVSCVVALKETFAETDAGRDAFEREAKLLANLEHPAFPRVIDHFHEGEGQYLVMEMIRGNDLEELLALRESPFSHVKVLEWADLILDALEELHAYRPPIIHRDIKPSNLKLTPKGKLKLLDFGIAKGAAGQMTTLKTDGSLGGYTPNYAPLEQILRSSMQWFNALSVINPTAVEQLLQKGTDARSDLYALGATMYHLMTGLPPVDAPTRTLSIWYGQPDPLRPAHELNPNIPPDVSALLTLALSLERHQRPSSATEMRRALRGAMQLPPAIAPTKSSPEIAAQARRRFAEESRLREEEKAARERRAAAERELAKAETLWLAEEEEETLRQEAETARLKDEAERQQAVAEAERQRAAERERLENEERNLPVPTIPAPISISASMQETVAAPTQRAQESSSPDTQALATQDGAPPALPFALNRTETLNVEKPALNGAFAGPEKSVGRAGLIAGVTIIGLLVLTTVLLLARNSNKKDSFNSNQAISNPSSESPVAEPDSQSAQPVQQPTGQGGQGNNSNAPAESTNANLNAGSKASRPRQAQRPANTSDESESPESIPSNNNNRHGLPASSPMPTPSQVESMPEATPAPNRRLEAERRKRALEALDEPPPTATPKLRKPKPDRTPF